MKFIVNLSRPRVLGDGRVSQILLARSVGHGREYPRGACRLFHDVFGGKDQMKRYQSAALIAATIAITIVYSPVAQVVKLSLQDR